MPGALYGGTGQKVMSPGVSCHRVLDLLQARRQQNNHQNPPLQ
jgi:hypothetical protein